MRSLKSLCNSYNNDLATISKSYPAERHISRDLDADFGCGSPHKPTLPKSLRTERRETRMSRHRLSTILTRVSVRMQTLPTMRIGGKAPPFPKWPAAIISMTIALSGAIGVAAHAEDVN